MRSVHALAIAAMTVGASVAAHAATIASDSYLIGSNPSAGQYAAGTSLASQAAVTAFGFKNTTGGSGTAQYQSQTLGLVNTLAGADSASSGKVGYINPNVTTLTRSTAHNLNAVANSSTYYVSHLVNLGTWSGTAAAGQRALLTGFGNATAPTNTGTGTSMTGLEFGFSQDGTAASTTAGGSLVIRYNNAGTSADQILLDGTVSSVQNLTYLVVARIDVTAGTDNVTWWVNPTDATDDSTLSSSALATGTFAGNVVNSGADFGRLNYYSVGWGNSVGASGFFDEARLSTDLAGLNFVAVPEPTTLSVLALGAMGLVRRRRA